jgi:hypoxanthine phosphoribosyltransferase
MKPTIKNIIARVRESHNPVLKKPYLLVRNLKSGGWEHDGIWKYVSMAEYSSMVHEWIREMPKDFDVVCAIPRSGLIPATMIATELIKPLVVADKNGQLHGWGVSGVPFTISPSSVVLLVDDGVATGNVINGVKQNILALNPGITLITASVFENITALFGVDRSYFKHSYDMRLIFEFNITRIYYGEFSVDMDGVLCRDYPGGRVREKYEKWVETADPYKIPIYKIKSIITNRDESVRGITEQWLDNYGVRYDNLIMNNGKDPVAFKIGALNEDRPEWFWESNSVWAKKIFDATGIPTLCLDTGEMHQR